MASGPSWARLGPGVVPRLGVVQPQFRLDLDRDGKQRERRSSKKIKDIQCCGFGWLLARGWVSAGLGSDSGSGWGSGSLVFHSGNEPQVSQIINPHLPLRILLLGLLFPLPLLRLWGLTHSVFAKEFPKFVLCQRHGVFFDGDDSSWLSLGFTYLSAYLTKQAKPLKIKTVSVSPCSPIEFYCFCCLIIRYDDKNHNAKQFASCRNDAENWLAFTNTKCLKNNVKVTMGTK